MGHRNELPLVDPKDQECDKKKPPQAWSDYRLERGRLFCRIKPTCKTKPDKIKIVRTQLRETKSTAGKLLSSQPDTLKSQKPTDDLVLRYY